MRPLVFAILLACSSGSEVMEGAATTAPPADDRGAAISLAKSCIAKNGWETVWHTTIAWGRVTAAHIADRRWVVDFPETGIAADGGVVTLGLPQGTGIDVDLDAKTCRQLMLE